MKKSIVTYYFLALVLAFDLSYSFLQYYHTPLDGDLAGGIIPANHVQQIFDDPFGFEAIISNTNHANPNRYFAHVFFKEYFSFAPFIYQKVTSPINSVYLSSATAKLLIHISLLYLLSALICQKTTLFSRSFLTTAVLLTPLFQAYGYSGSLGIIDHSITYTFFYAFPMLLLILFVFLFYFIFFKKHKYPFILKFVLGFLIVVLPFSGALTPPIVLILVILALFNYFFDKKKVFQNLPKQAYLFIIPLVFLCLYSLYLGTYNSSLENDTIPILERYKRLPLGIYSFLTQKLGYPMLLGGIILNISIIKKFFNTEKGTIVLSSFMWVVLFSIIYILLLPLGGFRAYRPNIIRFDTMLPVTVGLCFIFGKSALFLLKNVTLHKNIYAATLILFFSILSIADISNLNEANCEKEALKNIAMSTKKIVILPRSCTIVSWDINLNKESTRLNSRLLHFWNITNEEKLYIQK